MPGTLWPRLTPAPALRPQVRASLTPASPRPTLISSILEFLPQDPLARLPPVASHASRLQGSTTPSGCAGTAPSRTDLRPTSIPPWSRYRRCVRGARALVCWDTGALPSEVCGPAGPPPGVPGPAPHPAPPRGPGSRRGERKAAEAESLSLLSAANKAKGTCRTKAERQRLHAAAHRGAASRRPASGLFIGSRRARPPPPSGRSRRAPIRHCGPANRARPRRGVPGARQYVTAVRPIAPSAARPRLASSRTVARLLGAVESRRGGSARAHWARRGRFPVCAPSPLALLRTTGEPAPDARGAPSPHPCRPRVFPP